MEKYSFSLIKDPKTCLDIAGSQMYKVYVYISRIDKEEK